MMTPLRIAIVSPFYSEGMGYSENCLSRALARLGHEVHVIASTYNVYGNEALYDETYRKFLGPPQVAPGSKRVDGYWLHRLPAGHVAGYVTIRGLVDKIEAIAPDIVHTLEVASLQTFQLAAARRPFVGYKLFCETHQNLSIIRPYMLRPEGEWLKRATYRLTRTLPSFLSSLVMERCYAVAADCVDVAVRFYGVPRHKVHFLPLGTDTDTFRPPLEEADQRQRRELRASLGFGDDDIVCVYTGRFTRDKNPLLLARAIEALHGQDARFKALFIGEGVQRDDIAASPHATVLPFMTHDRLSQHYRAADIAVWPRQESLSMLDAAASGLPLVVSNRIGDPVRVEGNGRTYEENDAASLADVLRGLASAADRRALGERGRQKMTDGFSWTRFARVVEADFLAALGRSAAA